MPPKFALGQLAATPGALEALNEVAVGFLSYVSRHQKGDWGDVCAEDKAENELSLKHGLDCFRLTRFRVAAKFGS